MKNALIVALVGVNLALVVGLIFGHTGVPDADAQVIGAGTNYIMLTGKVSRDEDMVVITDLEKRLTVGLRYDRNKDEMVAYKGLRLKREFGRDDD